MWKYYYFTIAQQMSYFILIFLPILFSVLFSLFHLRYVWFKLSYDLLFTVSTVFFLYVVILLIKKRGLPGKSLRNPFGFIEIHICESNKGSKREFFRIGARTILMGISEGKNVLFATWHVNAREIEKYFSGAARIIKTSYIEHIFGMYYKWRYKAYNKHHYNDPVIKVIIDTKLLTNQQIKMLDKFAE